MHDSVRAKMVAKAVNVSKNSTEQSHRVHLGRKKWHATTLTEREAKN
jgi:hypothetical protein